MRTLLIIGTGGFIGTISRYALSQFIQGRVLSVFPFGTLGVNILGCFVIGVVFGLSERTGMAPGWRLIMFPISGQISVVFKLIIMVLCQTELLNS